jgi:hypothetical protein
MGNLHDAEKVPTIPIEKWGKDHWNTLAYIETRAVDHRGEIDNRQMRCDPRIHRSLANIMPFSGVVMNGGEYPTRLREGTQSNHDDWSCVEDMEALGLLNEVTYKTTSSQAFGNAKAVIQFTPKGSALAGQLRAHKARGGTFATFVPDLESLPK